MREKITALFGRKEPQEPRATLTFDELQAAMYREIYDVAHGEFAARCEELIKEHDPHGKYAAAGHGFLWVTREGNIIPFPFMKIDHLRNAYRYMYRQIKEALEHSIITLKPTDAAALAVTIQGLRDIRYELEQRNLAVPPWNSEFDRAHKLARDRAARRVGRASEINDLFGDLSYWFDDEEYDDWFLK